MTSCPPRASTARHSKSSPSKPPMTTSHPEERMEALELMRQII
jgi:hypothetical protein